MHNVRRSSDGSPQSFETSTSQYPVCVSPCSLPGIQRCRDRDFISEKPPKCATPFFSPLPRPVSHNICRASAESPGHDNEPPSTAVEPWRCQRGWVSRPPQPRPATLSSSHHPRHSSNSKPCRSCCSLGIGRSLRRRPAHLAPFTSRAPPLAVLPPRQLLQPRPRPLGTRRT